jgi:hypothetical protein
MVNKTTDSAARDIMEGHFIFQILSGTEHIFDLHLIL